MPRRAQLAVMCLLDSDVYRALERGGSRSSRSRIDAGIIRALRRLYSNVFLQPAWHQEAALDSIARRRPDVLFNLAYSGTEEESAFVARLETCGVPFTGSGSSALALTNDKARTRRVLERHGIRVPRWVELPVGKPRSLSRLRPPFLVKPSVYGGSSYGIHAASVVSSQGEALACASRLWTRFGEPAVCDEFIVGSEFRVGAIEVARTGRFSSVNVTESLFPQAKRGWGLKTQSIRSNDRVRLAQRIRTAFVERRSREYRQMCALADPIAHACEVRGYLTLDVRVDSQGQHFVVDVNANPGLSAEGHVWHRPSFEYNLRQIVLSALAAGPRGR